MRRLGQGQAVRVEQGCVVNLPRLASSCPTTCKAERMPGRAEQAHGRHGACNHALRTRSYAERSGPVMFKPA